MKINVKQNRERVIALISLITSGIANPQITLEVIQPCCSGKEAEWWLSGEPEFCPNPDCDGIEHQLNIQVPGRELIHKSGLKRK